ncbi:MAG: squalene/phytoene synthase family protein [Armatimonadetes bacterium]|nr:squalene/phytoene synthase family protein [Akkermansiaceae bacterium]
MSAELETDVLKGVSRSFYLSLRLLPKPMRTAASVGYLLARTSDTIADSAVLNRCLRMAYLESLLGQVNGEIECTDWPVELLAGIPDPKEKLLLENHPQVMGLLGGLAHGEMELVRELTRVIIGGQKLDLERFGAEVSSTVSLSDGIELEDYTWRVAGCVGVFWTKLGFQTMGKGFAGCEPEKLLWKAERYGKGLQLVNILRDLPKDLKMGRCYLPVADPGNKEALMKEFSLWREVACEWVGEGFAYAKELRPKRLRMASVLPAMIANETLDMLKGITFDELSCGIRVSRSKVYRMIIAALVRA